MSSQEAPQKPDLSKLRIARGESAASPTSFRPKLRPWMAAPIVLLIMLFAFSGKDKKPTADSIAQPQLQLQKVAPSESGRLTATGYVVAQRRAAVASKGTGRLRELRAREGDKVKEGDIIAVIENEDIVAQIKQLEAQVAALDAQVAAVQADADEAARQFERVKKMRKETLSSQSDLEQAEARYRRSIAVLAGAKANVALAAAQLEKGKVELDYTLIRAPFDGTVLTKNADVGEIVAPFGSSATARAAVVTIADMNSLQVEADVSESNISRVTVGQPCEITLDSFPDKRYRGEVTKIVPTVDRAKATVLTKIKFLDIDASVLPEMSAKVIFN